MAKSAPYGLKSAFYFACGASDKRYDANYRPDHPAIRSVMKKISERGYVIGLHTSCECCTDAERGGITQDEWGGRMHYLSSETPTVLYWWSKAEMQYDTTLGYAADIPVLDAEPALSTIRMTGCQSNNCHCASDH